MCFNHAVWLPDRPVLYTVVFFITFGKWIYIILLCDVIWENQKEYLSFTQPICLEMLFQTIHCRVASAFTLFPWLWIWILLFIKLWRGNTYILLSAQYHFLWHWNSTEWCSYLPLIEVHEATLRPVFFLTISVYYHYAGCCFAYWNHLCHLFPIFFSWFYCTILLTGWCWC